MIFGIPDDVLLNPDFVKDIRGIAGAGKGALLDQWFKQHNIRYYKYLSTNNLKKNHKYGDRRETIAAGLFTTKFPKFYVDFKEPDCDTIVIDEVLQSSPRVFDWIEEYRGRYNIFITCDDHQMLTPDDEENPDAVKIIDRYNDFCENDFVVPGLITQSLRPINPKTGKPYNPVTCRYYDMLYDLATKPELLSVEDITLGFIPTIPYDVMPFDTKSKYICHTRKIENHLFIDKRIQTMKGLSLLNKGSIAARKNVDPAKYPILSEDQAKEMMKRNKHLGYLQPDNIATPTRYQGSEIEPNTRLYYLVEPNSKISYRELYTVVTRCKDISSIVIVVVYDLITQQDEHDSFRGKPVMKAVPLKLDITTDTQAVSPSDMAKILKQNTPPNGFCFKNDVILGKNHDGKPVVLYYNNTVYFEDHSIPFTHYKIEDGSFVLYKPEKSVKYPAYKMVRKDGQLNYQFVPEIYNILEQHNLKYIKSPRIQHQQRDMCFYQVDMTNAYAQILKFGKIPCNGELITEQNQPGYMDFYSYINHNAVDNKLRNGSIIEDNLKNIIEQVEPEAKITYLFSVPYTKGCPCGDNYYALCHESVETKATVKATAHWGIWERKYLDDSDGLLDYFIKDEENKHELLFAAIVSQMLAQMMYLEHLIGGCYIQVDAVKLKDEPDIDTLKPLVDAVLPPEYEWKLERILPQKETLYANYEPLKTKDELRKEKRNERERAQRAAAKLAKQQTI